MSTSDQLRQQGQQALREGRPAEAERHFRQALSLAPAGDVLELLTGLVVSLRRQEKLEEAEAYCRQALAIDPKHPGAHFNLGVIGQLRNQWPAAQAHYRETLRLDPGHTDAQFNLAWIDCAFGRLEQGLACFRELHRRQPQHPVVHYNLGLALLALGHWTREAWDGYEARWQFEENPPLEFACPRWQGEPLPGKRLLLWSEQGHGDNLMMFRYAEWLAGRGVKVTVLASTPLASLLQRGYPQVEVTTWKPTGTQFDYHCPAMGLLRMLEVQPTSILAPGGYLQARPEPRPEGLAPDKLHVGLVWAGNPKHLNDRLRSLPHFRELAPLLNVPGIVFHSLQKGAREDECQGFGILQPAKAFRDFDDTAALVQHLDLVVAVDTATAHLAGALGKPVWLLLNRTPEWRWYPYGETTPWYPTARLFIQRQEGDWGEVVSRVAAGLSALPPPARPRQSVLAHPGPETAESFHTSFNLGLDALRAGRLDEAWERFRKAAELQPGSLQGQIALATVQTRRNQPQEAIRHYRTALALEPGNPDILYNLASLLGTLARWEEAEKLFLEALAHRPQWPQAANGLAQARWQQGKTAEAADAYRDAIVWNPQGVVALYNLGCLCLELGRCQEAEACGRQAQTLAPDSAEVALLLGSALARLGRKEDARQAFSRFRQLHPDSPRLWLDLGKGLELLDLAEEAAAAYRQAVDLAPSDAEGWTRLGISLDRLRRHQESIVCLRRAEALNPLDPLAKVNLGLTLAKAGEVGEAETSFRQALRLDPRQGLALNGLGVLLDKLGRDQEAEPVLRQALALDPEDQSSRMVLGTVLERLDRTAEALACYQQILQKDPDNARARLYSSLVRLSLGQWTAAAWEDYECRWQEAGAPGPAWPGREWQGEDLRGRRLLLWQEQGHGDNIMMFRYAELLADQGIAIALAVSPALASLFQRGHGRLEIATPEAWRQRWQEDPSALPEAHCPLMGLARRLRLTPEGIVRSAPYLHARPQSRPDTWDPSELHLGVVWAGSPTHHNDRHRSLPHFRSLAPWLVLPGIRLHSLLKGPREEECREFGIDQPGQGFRSFDDTAAFIQHLDLVVSVDTSVAHLSGALGIPTWILLPQPAEWRWYPYGETTPWYPSARLFVQRTRGDWDEVVASVTAALPEFQAARGRPHD